MFLSPEAPYPPVGGGALRSASLLRYLGRRPPVDRILFRQPGDPDHASAIPPEIVGCSCVIDLPYHRKDPLSKFTRNAWRALKGSPALIDRFCGFGTHMAEFLRGRTFRLGVIEHFWCAPYAGQLRQHCEELWLDLHNIESVLNDRASRVANRLDAYGFRRFAQIYRELEEDLFPQFDVVLVASETDAMFVREICPHVRTVVFPNAIPEQPRMERVEEDVIVFSGNMAYQPNKEAVCFFATKIWPVLRKGWPRLRWRLIGKNPEAVARYLKGETYIEVKGAVEDAVSELRHAKVAVVPVRAGSGTRVKILEAWAAATPVVSTRLGAEGLPVKDGEHLLLADDAVIFAETVSQLLASQSRRAQVGEAGRRLFEERFTWQAAWRNLDGALASKRREP